MPNNGSPEIPSQNDQQPSEPPPVPDSRDRADAPRTEPELPRWATRSAASPTITDTRLAAYIGPRWESSYKKKLARFVADPAFTPTWNWSAALASPFWFIYRKLYLAFAAFSLVPFLALRLLTDSTATLTLQNAETPEGQQLALTFAAISLSTVIAAGGTANWLLFRRARQAATLVTMQRLPEDAALLQLRRLGGINFLPAILFFLITAVINLSGILAPHS